MLYDESKNGVRNMLNTRKLNLIFKHWLLLLFHTPRQGPASAPEQHNLFKIF